MTFNKNVYFQNSDDNFYNQIYPFFLNLEENSILDIKKPDQKYFEEILHHIKENNTLPFKFNSQELLFFKKNEKKKWLDYFLFIYKFRK